MKVDAIAGSVKGNTEDDLNTVKQSDAAVVSRDRYDTVGPAAEEDIPAAGDDDQEEGSEQKPSGFPTRKSVESAMSEANRKLNKTRCEYSYDEPTKRVSIKVYDKETDELIREVPPEKSLEMLQKMWELAGLIVDERR